MRLKNEEINPNTYSPESLIKLAILYKTNEEIHFQNLFNIL
jgi:hypothetical protein